jgi:spermidine/putrescine transport system ATP-binding protein
MTRMPTAAEIKMNDVIPAIEIVGVSKSFSAVKAVDDVSLSISPGLFVTLLGPSGCGKSTLLRSIAGFAIPDRGTIRVAGRDITREAPHRRPVTMVFQDYALFPHMTVGENIRFGCEMKGMGRNEIAARCEAMLSLIRLPEIENRFPDALSGGQRQRVALARALAPDPVSILLDEPLGALDLKLRVEMQHELKDIQRRTGKTFVFVTHDQDEAMSMSDLVAVMHGGRIMQIDAPERLYARPASTFVAGFVGAANMIPAKVFAVSRARLDLEIAGRTWPVPSAAVTTERAPAVGEPATIIIRPEAVRIGPTDRDDALVLEVRLEERTFFGGRIHLRLRASDGLLLTAEARSQDCENLPDTVTVHCIPQDVAVLAEP